MPARGPLPSGRHDRRPRPAAVLRRLSSGFTETSKTGPSLGRLNARHRVLIHENRALFDGATVLDLASHDGRFSFVALHAGAERVVGIEHDPELVKRAHENFDPAYEIEPSRYRFECRDLFPPFDDLGPLRPRAVLRHPLPRQRSPPPAVEHRGRLSPRAC